MKDLQIGMRRRSSRVKIKLIIKSIVIRMKRVNKLIIILSMICIRRMRLIGVRGGRGREVIVGVVIVNSVVS